MFGFGKKVKNKLTGTRFEYSFIIHNLQPWPGGNRAIAIGYQRGKRRRGATRSVYPSNAPGKLGHVVRFNEKFDMPVTLYKEPSGKSSKSNNGLGPFKKKCLILAVLETDGKTQATAALGRVVIDLSEFAAVESQETRTFHVTCNKAIHAAVGDPLLMVTIRCRWMKAAATGGSGGMGDDAGSMSTDTTGSRMTANLSSFLRFRFMGAPQPTNTEQDLTGFDSKPLADTRSTLGPGLGGGMEAIEEDEGEPVEEQPARLTPTNSAKSLGYSQTSSIPERRSPYGESYTPPNRNGLVDSAAARSLNGISAASSLASTPTGSAIGGPDGSVRSRVAGMAAEAQSLDEATRAMRAELVCVAATEVSVYLAHGIPNPSCKSPERAMHAPARRIARTLVCLGPTEGTAFGNSTVQLIEGKVKAGTELDALAFWWSNCVHLRALLQAISLAGAVGSNSQGHWAAHVFLPQLHRLEKTIFEQLLTSIWDKVLMPAVTLGSKAASRNATANKRAAQEAAIKRWFEGFDDVNMCLQRLGSRGHVSLLKQQVLLQCLKKLDLLLFYHLLSDEEGVAKPMDILSEYDSQGNLFGNQRVPTLDEACLPFTPGLLTFQGGMSVKMTVTRLQQWATGDSALQEMLGSEGGTGSLFPLLRAAADLLMMPKELLMDRAIRLDVCSTLSIRSVTSILERFQPDEFAHDPVNPEVLASLKDEAAPSLSMKGSVGESSYKPPTDDVLIKRVEATQEPGLEYDAESEDDMEYVGRSSAGGGGPAGALRFKLLHQLWSGNVPRSKSMGVRG